MPFDLVSNTPSCQASPTVIGNVPVLTTPTTTIGTTLTPAQIAALASLTNKMNKTTGANTGGKVLIASGTTGIENVESIVAQSTLEGALGTGTYTNPATLDARLIALESSQKVISVATLPATGLPNTLYLVTTGVNKNKSFTWNGTIFEPSDREVETFATTLPAIGEEGKLYTVKTGANKGVYFWDGTAFQPTTTIAAPAPTTNVIDLTAGVLTTTVNGVLSNAVTITDTTTADNGLTKTGVNVQLGGTLITPTVITTDATNTLAIAGLIAGATTDTHLVLTPAGVIKLAPVELPFELLGQTIPASGSLVVTHGKNDITKVPVIDIMGLPNSPILADYSSAATNNLQVTNRTANGFTVRNINSSASITLDIRVK